MADTVETPLDTWQLEWEESKVSFSLFPLVVLLLLLFDCPSPGNCPLGVSSVDGRCLI